MQRPRILTVSNKLYCKEMFSEDRYSKTEKKKTTSENVCFMSFFVIQLVKKILVWIPQILV